MPFLAYFVAAERGMIDKVTEKVSLINTVDIVLPVGKRDPAPDDPEELSGSRYLIPAFFLAAQWWRVSDDEADKTFEQMVRITAPDGRVTDIVSVEFSFGDGPPVHRIVHQLGNISGRMPGLYKFSLMLREEGEEEWGLAADYPFFLVDIEEAASNGGAEPADTPLPPDGETEEKEVINQG